MRAARENRWLLAAARRMTLAVVLLALAAAPATSQTPPPHPVHPTPAEPIAPAPAPPPVKRAPPAGAEAAPGNWSADVKTDTRTDTRKRRIGRPAAAAAPAAAPVAAGGVVGSDARIESDVERTRFMLTVSGPVAPAVYTLADPYRVIVDLADVRLQLPASGLATGGFVAAWRHGLFAESTSRIVLDTTGPVQVERAELVAARAGRPAMVLIELAASDVQGFVAHPPPAVPVAAPQLRSGAFEEAPRPADGRPVIVIDPGHGGVDPGAVAEGDILEKHIVLSVARLLQARLAQSGRFHVELTRKGDSFVSLDQRVRFSKARGASLFVSLHADSVGEVDLAQSVRGASFYTLADRASDERAERLADKENAADVVAGLAGGVDGVQEEVRDILLDLMRRETAEFSVEMRGLLGEHLRQSVALAREHQRAAAFRVLRQPWCPAVLVELGYMSHADDRQKLKSPAWQQQVAAAIAAAVEQYFKGREPIRN